MSTHKQTKRNNWNLPFGCTYKEWRERNPASDRPNTRADRQQVRLHGIDLPLEHLREYDGAAEHFARHGELPQAMGSPGAIDFINADTEAFDQRCRDFEYAIAMEKLNLPDES